MSLHAIISADFIASQKIEPKQRAAMYSNIDKQLESAFNQWIKYYERFRGDSIQCEAATVPLCLRAALMLRCTVMAYVPAVVKKSITAKGYLNAQFDIRIAIGIGEIDFINKKQLSRSDGAAFVRSGEALDKLKTSPEKMVIKTGDPALDKELEPIVLLLDAIIQKWTQNGAAFVLQKLQGKKDDEIARLFGISLSAVTQRKKNAQWYAIEKAIQYFEQKLNA